MKYIKIYAAVIALILLNIAYANDLTNKNYMVPFSHKIKSGESISVKYTFRLYQQLQCTTLNNAGKVSIKWRFKGTIFKQNIPILLKDKKSDVKGNNYADKDGSIILLNKSGTTAKVVCQYFDFE